MSPSDPALLRLLDANANRAREALRAVEDYARFVLDDGDLSATLKSIRHDLTAALRDLLADAILHRDTPGDVGTANKTPAELQRADVADVVTAAGKRLGEALRAIEEYLKVIDPAAAARVEAARYRLYDAEQRIAFTLRPLAARFDGVRLYVLVTEASCRRPWLEAAEQAILGGADCLQLREKDLDSGELLTRARQLVELCGRHGVLSIINDRPDIALLAGADGVHVGQSDLPARDVRKLIGRSKILGVSTHQIEQARQTVADGADYLGVGPFFRSATKPRDFVAGPAYAREVVARIDRPAVAIAGITAENIDQVLATGVRAVAVTAAVMGRDDVRAAAAELKRKLVGGAGNPVGQTFLSVSPGATGIPAGGTDIPVCLNPPPGIPARPSLSASEEPVLQVTRRHLPHWELKGSTYFVTFRVHEGGFDTSERAIILDHVKSGDGMFYRLIAAVVMPDHAHLLIRPRDGVALSRIMKGTKGVTARLINAARGTRGSVWQDESWDRIMRDKAELDEKLGYMLDNPVKRGLIDDGWGYDGWFLNPAADEP